MGSLRPTIVTGERTNLIARRKVLQGLGLTAFASVGPDFVKAARRTKGAPLGLVEITIARELAADYAGTLRKIAAMGYTDFGFRLLPFAAGPNDIPGLKKAQMVREAGLNVGVVRFGSMKAVDVEAQISDAARIGAKVIALSAAPPFFTGKVMGTATHAAFDAWLPEMEKLSLACRKAGLTLAYHNHWWDVQPLEGGDTPIDILLRHFSPHELSFEVDVGWAWFGGADPLALVRRLGKRVVSMHFKDVRRAEGKNPAEQMVVIGSGEMNYRALLPKIAKLTSATGYVEVDITSNGVEAAAQGAKFVRG